VDRLLATRDVLIAAAIIGVAALVCLIVVGAVVLR
jgi:hypothetical protein